MGSPVQTAFAGNDYRVLTLDLSTVADNRLIEGVQGSTIYTVTILTLPAGAQLALHFGRRDPVPISDRIASFSFACGFADGLYLTVPVAQPGTLVQVLVGFSPIAVSGA